MQSQGTNPDLDFILNQNTQPKKTSLASGIPKPIKIVLAAAFAIIVLIVIFAALSSRSSGGTTAMLTAMERGQETLRVTDMVKQLKLEDPQTLALAATVSGSLASDQAQFGSYLAKNKTKISTAQLAADTDKSVDAAMTAASQNNNLDDTYIAYLKDALSKYQTELHNAYSSVGPNGQQLLADAFDSAQTLLTTAPLKS